MKKITLSIILCLLMFIGNAYAMFTADLSGFGSLVTLPLTPPTIINIMGGGLRTIGSVDFAVLYNATSGIYSYFYQVKNLGGGLNDTIGRFTVDNLYGLPLIGSGIMGDGLDPVQLIANSTLLFGANMDQGGNYLIVNQTTNRFYFQFAGEPGITDCYLIDGGIGSGKCVGPIIPEPTSMLLFGMGILGLLGLKRRKA